MSFNVRMQRSEGPPRLLVEADGTHSPLAVAIAALTILERQHGAVVTDADVRSASEGRFTVRIR